MTRHEHAITDDAGALAALDVHHGMLLGCPASDLRRPGWHVLVARMDADPMAMLFGRRDLVRLVAPACDAGAERAGVVLVAPELRVPVTSLLRTYSPTALLAPAGGSEVAADWQRGGGGLAADLAPSAFRLLPSMSRHAASATRLPPPGLAALDALVREAFDGGTTLTAAYQHLRYTFAGEFRPYRGQWLEWIEPLDEAREMDPVALGLLARFSRGVYVIRQGGRIVAYAGLRQQSPHVWDLAAQTQAESLLGHGLGRAVISRATRAALAEGRLPLAAHAAGDAAAVRIARALGYRLYGETVVYSVAS